VNVDLLVVPRHAGNLQRSGEGMPESFCDWLRGLSERGHRLWLHGLVHADPLGGEAEFRTLSSDEMRRRLDLGRRDWNVAGLPGFEGFCPPCWKAPGQLASVAAEEGFLRTASRWGIREQGHFELLPAVSSWGGDSPLARAWGKGIGMQVRMLEKLHLPWRLVLHPQDLESPVESRLAALL
jgi:predicted deacetylase